MIEQSALFDKRTYKGSKPQLFNITPPAADQTVLQTIPAYYTYLSSGKYSQYTPDDYSADIKRFGQFTAAKPLEDITKQDIRQWITQLKQTMPPKTVNRKVSAIGNYFRWLSSEHVIKENPAASVRAEKVHAPLPNILYDEEIERLLKTSSQNPRTYLLVLLFLETGMKKSELVNLQIGDFDFSNKYQPEVWVKHGGKHTFKDRRLKLPREIIEVFNDYIEQFRVTDALFPYTQRFISKILAEAAKNAEIRKQVTASILRDVFVVRSVKRGMKLEGVLEKIGLSKSSYDDARKKYGHLIKGAL